MPHSSGGGSHSGGSHTSSHSSGSHSGGSHSGGSHYSSGSSFRSSGGSHSGGFSRYSSPVSSPRYSSPRRTTGNPGYGAGHSTPPVPRYTNRPHTSSSPFEGATRYVYYRDKTPHYIYSDHTTFLNTKHPVRFFLWLPVILIFLYATFSLMLPPAKVVHTYDSTILIKDDLNVIDNQSALMSELQAFYDETGITACVYTEANENWQNHYDSLEARAYDLYVNSFADEYHWLIVYTEPAEPDAAFVDWYWEAIQGDETDRVLNEKAVTQFTKSMQRYLTSTLYSPGKAIAKSFSELTPTLMQEQEGSTSSVIVGFLLTALLIFIACKRAGFIKKKATSPADLPRDAIPVKAASTELSCSYCGGVYLSDRTTCPHCGAAKQASGL